MTEFCKSQLGEGWSSHSRLQVTKDQIIARDFTWDDLPKLTQQMFFGVAMGWWEDVDIARGMPIPFPLVFNLRNCPPGFTTMAHVLAKFKLFKSVSEARKNGWDKPIKTGEFWLHKRTARVLIIWVDENDDPEEP